MSAYLEAVLAIDSGSIAKLEELLRGAPKLIEERCLSGPWYEEGYFRGAMLLHHVAGNPVRRPIAPNVIDVARVLLEHGADPNARTEGGCTTTGLLLTSKQASEAGVAAPLLDLLRSKGARDEFLDARALTSALSNCAPATAEELIRRGAPMDLRHAAGLGRLDDVERLARSQPDLREAALLLACMRGQAGTASALVASGARGDALVALADEPVRTALHEAANRGYEAIVRMLVEHGADRTVVEPRFQGTPAGWAQHGNHDQIADFLNTSR